MPGGRPRIIDSPEEFDQRADAYFAECDENKIPYTITGLSLALGFVAKQSLYDYQDRPEFSDCVKRARLRVENGYEIGLSRASNVAGQIFALKNFGWSDRREHEHSGSGGGPVEVIYRVAGPESDEG